MSNSPFHFPIAYFFTLFLSVLFLLQQKNVSAETVKILRLLASNTDR